MIKVIKFGGTSVGSTERIKNVANIIYKISQQGHKVIAIVSAMSGITDQLIVQSNNITTNTSILSLQEQDVILSTGEQISSALLALSLIDLGLNARSWQGWQIPIITNQISGKARIKEINSFNLLSSVEAGEIAIISGFQGVDKNNKITTLGRGGSDTSAVAIACAVNAKECEIYTDVEGVFSTDPRIVEDAKKLEQITFEEMLELSALGSKVLHHRSVEIAFRENLDIWVKSTFDPEKKGTLITSVNKINKEDNMENNQVTGIAIDTKEVQVKITTTDYNNIIYIIDELAKIDAKPDMMNIIDKNTCIFNINNAELPFIEKIVKSINVDVEIEHNIAKISIVGVGIRSNFNIINNVIKLMSEKLIDIYNMSCSEIKISINVPKDYAELALRVLHNQLV